MAKGMARPQPRNTKKKPKGKRGNGGRRTRGDKVLAQGTGRTAIVPFGGGGRPLGLECWDAFHPSHLPLPRSVGAYTVVRTSRLVTTTSLFNYIGTFGLNDTWADCAMFTSVDSTLPVNALNNTQRFVIPFPGIAAGNSALTCVPAAISVQVMNQNALQTTAGIVAGTVVNTQLDFRGRTDTWDDVANQVISFMRPRLMSAGKLALRGVQADAYPLNMASLADFAHIVPVTDSLFTLDAASPLFPQGFSPIVVINEGAKSFPPLALTYLITIEWRVRFDLSNPAVASHLHHGITTDHHWDAMVRGAQSRSHGFLDIVERIANTGSSVARAIGTGAMAARAIGPAALPLMA